MKPDSGLFDLIKSLTKSEKRYFKLFASMQKGSKNYIRLFDEIERQAKTRNCYDEAAIKSKFKKEKFIRQLTFTKNYLYRLILKSLELYNGENTTEFRLNGLINRCKILYGKALYRQFFGTTEYSKKIARKHERWNYYMKILEMQKIVFIKKIYPSLDVKKIIGEEKEILIKINNLSQYSELVGFLSSLYMTHGRERDEELHVYLRSIEKNPLLLSPEAALSIRAKEHYLFIQQIISDFRGDFEGMDDYSKKRYELVSKHPEVFDDLPFNYWQDTIMYRLLLSIRFDKNYEAEIQKYIEELKKHSKATEADRINIFLMENYFNLQLIIKNRQWNILDDAIDKIEKGFTAFGNKIDYNFEVLMYNSIVRALILNERYSDSVKYLNLLLNNPRMSIRKDLEWYVRVINLLVHYELQNYTLLEYLIKSTYRYLLKSKKLYKLELSIINFIKKLPRIKDDAVLLENLELLRDEMIILKNDPFEKNAFLYFNFISWADRKIAQLKGNKR